MTPSSHPELPAPRGPLSEAVVEALRRAPGPVRRPRIDDIDMLTDDDAQLALACCYELHYQGFQGVDDGWEWSPDLLAIRGRLEQCFVRRLEDEVGAPGSTPSRAVVPTLRELAERESGPSLSRFLQTRGDLDHVPLVPRAEADHALRKAAELGHPYSQQLLAVLLDRGSTIKRDPAAARYWAERAVVDYAVRVADERMKGTCG